MPRPNQPRSLQSEANLALRIAHEREARGWTYEGMAKRMTDVGCAIQSSAIYKIEKGDPPRRVTVDELVAMSAVLGIDLPELLLPMEVVQSREQVALVEQLTQVGLQIQTLAAEWYDLWRRFYLIDAEMTKPAADLMRDLWSRPQPVDEPGRIPAGAITPIYDFQRELMAAALLQDDVQLKDLERALDAKGRRRKR